MAGIAAGLIHTGVSKIDQRDLSGYHTGMLSTNEYAFFAAFGLRVGFITTIGVGLQLFRNDLHQELSPVQTFGLDIGLAFWLGPSLHVGLVVDDCWPSIPGIQQVLVAGALQTSFPDAGVLVYPGYC